MTGVRLHVRAEQGGATIHPPYDVAHLVELFNQRQAAYEAGNQWAEGEWLNEIADYLALRLTLVDADYLARELLDVVES